jgi:hypothetical protein
MSVSELFGNSIAAKIILGLRGSEGSVLEQVRVDSGSGRQVRLTLGGDIHFAVIDFLPETNEALRTRFSSSVDQRKRRLGSEIPRRFISSSTRLNGGLPCMTVEVVNGE